MLSDIQRADFDRDGFLVIEDFATPADCRALMARMGELLDGFDPDSVRSIFTTHEQTRVTDDYFLTSGDQIRFFFEEDAFDGNGTLKQKKALSINKVGHALHDLDPVFERFSRDRRLGEIVQELGQGDPRLIQSMYIFKQPHIGGEVTCHQDATFLITDPPSVLGLWFALEDATVDNGCLWALPGAHKGPLKKLFRRNGSGGTTIDTLDGTPFPEDGEGGAPYVPLEARQGTLVVLHGLCPHRSGPNRSAKSRHAYAVHTVDGRYPYGPENWLQRPADNPARGF